MKIDLLPQQITVVHFLDFDVEKLMKVIEKLMKVIEKLMKVIEAVATSLGLIAVTVAVILIGGFASICLAVIIATLLLAPKAVLPEAAAATAEEAAAEETRNLLRIAILNISYIRGLFPEKNFNDKSGNLVMKFKDLMRMDAESRRMIDWMEKGVCDALQKKHLKTLLLCVCETVGGPMIEEYAFSFSYPDSEITPNQMSGSACKIRALSQLLGTLNAMPEERTILMKLYYDGTPLNYKPPCFTRCTEEVNNPWTKNPLKMEVSNFNSKDLVFDLEVKSVLGPYPDNSDVNQPAASRGFIHVTEIARTNGNGRIKGGSASQSKRPRKASVVSFQLIYKILKF